jgi:restriction endonuclease S subunit
VAHLERITAVPLPRFQGRISSAPPQDVEEAIRKALLLQYRLHIHYRKGPDCQTYLIEPYTLVLAKGGAYLLAFTINRNAMRLFAMERIISAAVQTERFEIPEGFQPESCFNDAFGLVSETPHTIEVLFSSTVAHLIEAAKCRKEALLRHLLTEKRRMNKKNGLWQKRRLGDVASINLDTLLESTDPDREFKYIDLSSIDLGKIELPDKTTRFCEAPNRARRLMEKGDILLATVRPSLQGYALVDFDASDCVCSTGFAVLRPKAGNNSEFIYQVLFSNKVQQQFHAMVTGSSYPSLNEGDIASVHVTVPDFSEQCAIAAILTTADDEVRTLEAKTAALERQKKGLMQKLLTGQVRVKM